MKSIPSTNQKPWGESEFLERLRQRELPTLPAEVVLSEARWDQADSWGDGILEVTWQGRTCSFVFDYKTQNTPKSLEALIASAQRSPKAFNTQRPLLPMIIVPYLSEETLRLLENEKVSGIDLCGNAIILAPNFALYCSGKPNRFKQGSTIRNIYWGNSSLIARCFLLRSEYRSFDELRGFALQRFRGGSETNLSILTKGTVSKVVQALEEEKIITRTKAGIRLSDPQALLNRLKANYRKPQGACVEGKTPFAITEAWARLNHSSLRVVVSGDSSATHYRVLSGQDKIILYVDDIEKAQQCLEIISTPLFPNIELREEKNDLFYFDTRSDGDMRWASPIQTWMELALGGPRERTAAEELETILRKGEGASL